MARQDTTDFLTAFAVGTVLGIGATLLLRPAPESAKERLMRELKPYRRKMRKSAAKALGVARRSAGETGDVTADAIDAGRELLAEFRDEVRRILAEATEELRQLREEDGGHRARRRSRRAERRLGTLR